MESGQQMAVALGVGYVLGRRRKRRLAIMLGTAALMSGSGGPAGQLIRGGAKMVGSTLGKADVLGKVSPEVGEITGLIRGDLLEAGKGAAKAAVTSRIDSLTDRLHDQAETMRSAAEAGSAAVDATGDVAREAGGREETGRQAANGAHAPQGARRGTRPGPRAAAQERGPVRARQRPAAASGRTANNRSASSGRTSAGSRTGASNRSAASGRSAASNRTAGSNRTVRRAGGK
jgi:hypothetical protein